MQLFWRGDFYSGTCIVIRKSANALWLELLVKLPWVLHCFWNFTTVNWQSRWLREFDHHATRILGEYEVKYFCTCPFKVFKSLIKFFSFYQTVDTFYRRCSSVNFLSNVSVPLLCITALDDPLCTKESTPWDECR